MPQDHKHASPSSGHRDDLTACLRPPKQYEIQKSNRSSAGSRTPCLAESPGRDSVFVCYASMLPIARDAPPHTFRLLPHGRNLPAALFFISMSLCQPISARIGANREPSAGTARTAQGGRRQTAFRRTCARPSPSATWPAPAAGRLPRPEPLRRPASA